MNRVTFGECRGCDGTGTFDGIIECEVCDGSGLSLTFWNVDGPSTTKPLPDRSGHVVDGQEELTDSAHQDPGSGELHR